MLSWLSIVVPLFNEEKRILLLLEGMVEFCRQSTFGCDEVEWVLVDDGSRDATWEKLQTVASELEQKVGMSVIVNCQRLIQNAGKGAALKAGVEASSGQWVLTMDADMATDPKTLEAWLRDGLWDVEDFGTICIGSRVHQGSSVDDGVLRRTMGRTFNLVTRTICWDLSVGDSQCGFKLYPGTSGRELFSKLKCMGWAHDVELLLRAQNAGLQVRENPVDWRAVDDSRVNPLVDAFGMFFQVLQIRTGLRIESVRQHLKDPWVLGALALLLGSLALIFSTYPQRGISIDDPIQQLYGEYCAEWYLSGFEDESALTLKNLRFYGGAFELWPGLVAKFFPELPTYPVRRILSALLGLLGVVAAWRLAWLVTGKSRAGFIAAVLLLLNPFFVGHQFINTKDGPFAVVALWCLFYLAQIIRELPKWSIRTALKLGVVLGLALGIRVGGAIFAPTIVFAVAWTLWQATQSGSLRIGQAIQQLGKMGVVIAVSAYGTMIAFWPAAQVHPFLQPWQALTKSVNFGWNGQVRFFGELPRAMELPRYYDPLLLFFQTPEALLAGAALAILFCRRIYRCLSPSARVQFLALGMAALLPIFTVTAGKAILFDKARHLLFVVGPLTVVSAIAWHVVASWGLWWKRFALGSLGLLLVLPAVRLLQLHPYEYTYFNELAGGPNQGYQDFGADYWFQSGWEALSELDAYLREQGLEASVAAVFCPGFPKLVQEFAEQHPSVRLTLDKGDADYFALSTRVDIDKDHAGVTVARVGRFGFDFFVVKKRAPKVSRRKK